MNDPSADRPLLEWESRVVATLSLVHHVVADVAGRLPRFVDREELISAGMLGLTQAARSFDPAHGVTFQVFARVRIRGAVLDELRHRDQLSRGARRRATDVSTVTTRMQSELGRCPSDAEVAASMDVDGSVVRRAHEDLNRAAALENPMRSLGVGEEAGVAATEAGPMAQLLDAELRGYLIDAVAALPERLRVIVVAHFFDEREMRDIAVELGVTASRVSQLCARGRRAAAGRAQRPTRPGHGRRRRRHDRAGGAPQGGLQPGGGRRRRRSPCGSTAGGPCATPSAPSPPDGRPRQQPTLSSTTVRGLHPHPLGADAAFGAGCVGGRRNRHRDAARTAAGDRAPRDRRRRPGPRPRAWRQASGVRKSSTAARAAGWSAGSFHRSINVAVGCQRGQLL